MNSAYKNFRSRVLLALLAVIVLITAGIAVLDASKKEYKNNISGHVISNLETISRGVVLLQQDSVARVRKISDEAAHRDLTARLLAHSSDTSLHRAYETWITPLYQSHGFDDYSLISADGKRIITSGTRAFIGQLPQSAIRDTLLRAELMGGAVAPPITAHQPVATLFIEHPSTDAYQLSCARVDKNGRLIGFLCLHENPSLRLYRILRDGRAGVTGEVYVVDHTGMILSPIRFEKKLVAPAGARPGWSLLKIPARIMSIQDDTGLADPSLISTEPFTQVVERLMEYNSLDTGLLENYADYRSRKVVGAGRWLPDAAMAIIVEEDMDEAFRSYYFARMALVSLISLGSMLIVLLTYVDWRSRRSLARSEQRLAAFRDYIPAGLNMKSASGHYLMINPVFEAIADAPPGQVLGKTDAELFSEEEAQERMAEHKEVLNTGQAFTRKYTKRYQDGREETYSIVRFPVRGENTHSVVAVGTVALNITELIHTQHDLENLTQTLENKVAERTEQLAAARDLAESASRAKAEFLANMSHEIRTPLNAIIGMSHLAAHANASPRVGHYISRIQSSGQHLLGVINDILDLSKIEAGKLQMDMCEFSLESLLQHVADLVSERAETKELELIISIGYDLPCHLLGDSMRIGQILINFANNAVKFTEHGEITLRVKSRGRTNDAITVLFEVEDSGIGIAADHIPLLFSPFQQIDGSMSRQFEGTGLGLAISRNLAERMHGHVDVRSQLGCGSVFSLELTFPLHQSISSKTISSIDLHTLRALVVDDHAQARSQLAEQLRSLSITAHEAFSGEEALRMVAQADHDKQRYDMVFIDWKMPTMSGLSVAAAMQPLSLQYGCPHRVLLASGAQELPDTPDRQHINALLAKPITPSELLNTIISIVDPAPAHKQDATGAPDDWKSLHARSILLVEDNQINQEVVQDLLEMVGARVTIASDGLQGIALLKQQPFDLVLMDVHMPNMDGFEATAAIRQDAQFATIPIIALTANALDGDLERCLAAGMSDYITKPIHPQRLFSTLAQHIQAVSTVPIAAPKNYPQQPAPAEEKVFQRSNNDQHAAIIAAIAQIPGVDTQLAISRMMGRQDMYAHLACRMASERADMVEKLNAAMREGQCDTLFEIIHSAQSLLGTLGAVALQQRCIDLQKLLHDGVSVEKEIAAFCADLAVFLRQLHDITRPA